MNPLNQDLNPVLSIKFWHFFRCFWIFAE